MARVLMISKPVVPPWNDSGKNLVRDLACALSEHVPTVMGCRGAPQLPAPVCTRPLYPARASAFAPRRVDQARVFASVLADRQHDLWHYFFAPNPVSCLAGAMLGRVRCVPSVHTVSSAPRSAESIVPRLFADVHVVLSQHTCEQLHDAGLAADRLVRIPPCVAPLSPPADDARVTVRRRLGLPTSDPLVVFPGDLEFGGGAELCVRALPALRDASIRLVLACREKTGQARVAREQLQQLARELGVDARVHWIGETSDIHGLLGAADVVALPSKDLYAKMDYPLVLLEAMALERPVVVAAESAAAELADMDGAVAVAAQAEALAGALAALIEDEGARRSQGQRAARCVRENFAPAVIARAYAALYDRLL